MTDADKAASKETLELADEIFDLIRRRRITHETSAVAVAIVVGLIFKDNPPERKKRTETAKLICEMVAHYFFSGCKEADRQKGLH